MNDSWKKIMDEFLGMFSSKTLVAIFDKISWELLKDIHIRFSGKFPRETPRWILECFTNGFHGWFFFFFWKTFMEFLQEPVEDLWKNFGRNLWKKILKNPKKIFWKNICSNLRRKSSMIFKSNSVGISVFVPREFSKAIHEFITADIHGMVSNSWEKF